MWYSNVLMELFQAKINVTSEIAKLQTKSRKHYINYFAEILTSRQGLRIRACVSLSDSFEICSPFSIKETLNVIIKFVMIIW
jgi:hypothetical protein